MAQALSPDGTPVTVEGVTLSTPGLTGEVEVLPAGAPGLRMREGAADAFVAAIASAGFMEQLTIEISRPAEVASVAGLRGGGGPEITVSVPDPGRYFAQVLLYTAEDGTQSWHLPREPQGEPGRTVRATTSLTYTIPRAVQPAEAGGGPVHRGLIWAVGRKLLKVLAFPLLERGTAVVAERLATRWEAEHRPYLLRTFGPDDYTHTEGRGLDAEDWARFAQGPALLFLHGTFSRSDLAFRDLPPHRFEELYELYQGRVFAFDHPTLSADPAANAHELVARIPADRKLQVDVIAHSRGGLVGRELAQHVQGPRVRRLVMVGTPNAGTVLADSKHWGVLIDRMTNLLQFVPDNPVTDTLDAVLTVLKHLALGAVRGLDGLAAMDPAGAYLRERLNRPLPPDAGAPEVLHAITSDYDPPANSPLARVSRNGLTDLVFGRDGNDLVVPTHGVYRLDGVPGFPVPDPLLLQSHAGVDHTTYFTDPAVGERLAAWLR
ncbi:hypothetical protein Kisp01_55110 [Kineosporia sp. NBRC 101677]|uniref:DUF7379 domain-containing protein n=1 Tax=Kineosporia sp. NBRC 101677 TaxID=3032197 RepID=UPI0024A52B15|nr:hypothetical protein [Kineosporia sp. NBRC 101677]GLY18497.1 hypothetical protein Kisp01_55110 [Kineosporia sp. NBRC 101677]